MPFFLTRFVSQKTWTANGFQKPQRLNNITKKKATSIYDSTYAWRDNILTAAASLALPSYGSHYSGVSRLA
jgi:lysozyme family protein